jgi:hypothetical protein
MLQVKGNFDTNGNVINGSVEDQILVKKFLEPNRIYEVERIDVGSWYTKVYIKGLKECFNSVCVIAIDFDMGDAILNLYNNRNNFTLFVEEQKQMNTAIKNGDAIIGKYLPKLYKLHEGEHAHMDADDILCNVLDELGYGEITKAFKRIKKWYS